MRLFFFRNAPFCTVLLVVALLITGRVNAATTTIEECRIGAVPTEVRTAGTVAAWIVERSDVTGMEAIARYESLVMAKDSRVHIEKDYFGTYYYSQVMRWEEKHYYSHAPECSGYGCFESYERLTEKSVCVKNVVSQHCITMCEYDWAHGSRD